MQTRKNQTQYQSLIAALIAIPIVLCINACSQDEERRGLVTTAITDGEDPCIPLGHTVGCDVCALEEWYDDGTCDGFCIFEDPDCSDDFCDPAACGFAPPTDCDPPLCADGTAADCISECRREDDGSCEWFFGFSECSEVTDDSCGPEGLTCDDDEFCDYEHNSCGLSGEVGLCKSRPIAWDGVVDHVCGCDGVTYDHEGEAQDAGVDIIRRGPCEDRFDSCVPEECGTMPPGCAPPICSDGTIASCSPLCSRGDDDRCRWTFEYGECPDLACDAVECGEMPPGCDPPMCDDGNPADCTPHCSQAEDNHCRWFFDYGECS